MMMRKVALVMALLLGAVPFGVNALGLADIELRSALNQPLDARIPLKALQAGDVEGMQVNLGTSEQFKRAGLERPFLLSQLRFEVVEEQDGSAYIAVTTKKPVKEPFLNFLIEVNWPLGRVLREYTMLLDPPVYAAAISAAVNEAVATAGTPPLSAGHPSQTDEAIPTRRVGATRGGASTNLSSDQGGGVPSRYGPITSTDTLWVLAERFRPDSSVNIQQTMLAMLKANPDAFIQDNMNLLKAGAVIRIPRLEEIDTISRSEALAEFKRQNALWQEYRQALAAKASRAPEGIATSTPAGRREAAVEQATSAPVEEEARLELLSAGSATTDASGFSSEEADVGAVHNELKLAQEALDTEQQENKALKGRLTEAEALIEDLQRLVELKDDTIAALQNQLAQLAEGEAMSTEQVEVAPAAETQQAEIAEATETQQAEIAEATETGAEGDTVPGALTETTPVDEVGQDPSTSADGEAVSVPERPSGETSGDQPGETLVEPRSEPPSLFDSVLDALPLNPVVLGAGLGGLLILGGGLAMVLRKRRATGGPEQESVVREEAVSTREARTDALVSPEADTVVSRQFGEDVATEMGATPPAPETHILEEPVKPEGPQDDPLAEVNVYLAYERFDQAEELVKEAIEKYPHRHEYKLKLLEIYYAAKNVTAFEGYAHVLRRAVDEDSPLLEKATAWWRELSGGGELLAPAPEESASDTADSQFDAVLDEEPIFDVVGGEEGASFVDSDTFPIDPEPAMSETADATHIDFDLGFDTEPAAEGAVASPGEESVIDFDLGFETEPADHTDTGERGLSLESLEALAPEKTAPTRDNEGLDLAPRDGAQIEPDAPIGDVNTVIDFDLNAMNETSEEDPGEVQQGGLEEANATGTLDFDLDFEDMEMADEGVAEERKLNVLRQGDGNGEEGLDINAGVDAPNARFAASMPAEDGSMDLEPALDPKGEDFVELDTLKLRANSLVDNEAVERADLAQTDDVGVEFDALTAAGENLEVDSDFADLFEDGLSSESRDDIPAEEATGLALETPESTQIGESVEDFNMELADIESEIGPEEKTNVNVGPSESLDTPSIDDNAELEPEFDLTLLESETSLPEESEAEAKGEWDATHVLESDAVEESPTLDGEVATTLGLGADTSDGGIDEMQTRLDLAQAYIDMGDSEGARGILDEVMAEGSDAQKHQAKELLANLS